MSARRHHLPAWRALPLLTALAGSSALCALGCTAGAGDGPSGSGATTSDGGNPSGGNAGTGAGPSGTGGSGATTSGGSGSGGTVPPPVLPSECGSSQPGSRLLRRLTQQELLNSQADVFGQAAEGAVSTLPGDAIDKLRLSNDSAILTMAQDAAQAVLNRAEEIADAVTAPSALANNLPCASGTPDESCASTFITKYGEALFRRPLDQSDVDRYLGLFRSVSAASDFSTGLKWVLVGLTQSPYAVYRTELGSSGQLTPYEIASELSYDYSASPPSADLIAKALSGALDDPEVRYQEAKKLLTSTRGEEVIRQFFEEWLSYRDALSVSRDTTVANFEQVRPKMVVETERFLDMLLFDKGGKLVDLLTADFTVADQELAAYYGFSGGSGDIMSDGGAEVKRDWGLGVFAQGSVATTMASIRITSPTRRGLLLLRRLYCEVPGLPQAVNFDLTSDIVSGNTTRERLENSHLKDACKGCHTQFDPLGFGFEHIDNVGRYRTDEITPNGTFPIDASATVASLGGLEIDGQEELMHGLATDPTVLSCISATMSRYVYGGDGTCRDPVARTRAMAGETSMVDFLAELAREPHFVQRAL